MMKIMVMTYLSYKQVFRKRVVIIGRIKIRDKMMSGVRIIAITMMEIRVLDHQNVTLYFFVYSY